MGLYLIIISQVYYQVILYGYMIKLISIASKHYYLLKYELNASFTYHKKTLRDPSL